MDAGSRAISKQCSDHTVHNDSSPHRHTPRCFIVFHFYGPEKLVFDKT